MSHPLENTESAIRQNLKAEAVRILNENSVDWTRYPDLVGSIAEALRKRDEQIAELQKELDTIDREVSKVYCYMTGGKMSKPNYIAEQVIAVMEEEQQKYIDEAIREDREERNNG